MADELLRALGREQKRPAAASQETDLDASTDTQEPDAMLRRFDDDERAALLDSVFDAVDAKVEQDSEDSKDSEDSSESAESAKVVAIESRRPGRMWLAVALAAAAAILLAFLLRGSSTPVDEPPRIASLPAYQVTKLRGGVAKVRDRPDAPPKEVELTADSPLDWELAPDRPVREPVGLVILATSDGGAKTIVPEVDVSPEGVVRLHGPASSRLPLPAGRWKLELVVVPKTALVEPSDSEAADLDARWNRHLVWATISP